MSSGLIIILIVAGFILLLMLVSYNSLISRKNKVQYAFSSIDAMLKKRYDLIPNLVESVKHYMNFEKNLLISITSLRTEVMNKDISDQKRFLLENQISSALGKINVAVENYPELKANQNFLQMQATLNEVEEQLSASRRAFNASVMDYNNAVEKFPSNIFAGMFGFRYKASFEIPQEQRENVNVKNLFNS